MASPVKAVLAFVENGDEVAIKKILATDPNIKVYDFDPRGICWEFYANVPIDDVVELINGRCWSGLLVVFATSQSATMFTVALDTIPVGNASMLFPTNDDNVLLEYLSELDPTMPVGDDVVSSVFEQDFPEDDPTPAPEEAPALYTTAVVAYFDKREYAKIKAAVLKSHPEVVFHDFDVEACTSDLQAEADIIPITDITELLGVGIPEYAGGLVLSPTMGWVKAISVDGYCMMFPTTDVAKIWAGLKVVAPDQIDVNYILTEKGVCHVSGTSDSPAQ